MVVEVEDIGAGQVGKAQLRWSSSWAAEAEEYSSCGAFRILRKTVVDQK